MDHYMGHESTLTDYSESRALCRKAGSQSVPLRQLFDGAEVHRGHKSCLAKHPQFFLPSVQMRETLVFQLFRKFIGHARR